MTNDMTPGQRLQLRIFNHIDKLPPYQSPECRLVHMDDIIEGQKADALNEYIVDLVKAEAFHSELIDLNGVPHLLIRMTGVYTSRWREKAAQFLENK